MKKYLLILAMPLIAAACKDDSFLSNNDYTIAGEEVTVTIPISIPKMTVQTRASITDEQLSEVNSLWIAVFNADSHEITSYENNDKTGSHGWYVVNNPSNKGFHNLNKITINTLSGPSYIVAVANVENLGVTSDNPDAEPVAISTHLKNANKWEDFLKIAAVTPNNMDGAYAPTAPMTMSGCFIAGPPEGGNHPADWQAQDFERITIPYSGTGSVTLDDGAIHLRRLMSHITFNVSATTPTPVEGETAPENPVVDVKVLSYRIVNLPARSWLYERGNGSDGATPNLQNFGDINTNIADTAKYYASANFTSQYIKDTENGTGQTFDFWQSENKHTGYITKTDEKEAYNQREKKTLAEGTTLYNALCKDGENITWSPNNMASYVVITCEVKYKDQVKVGENGVITDNGKLVYRTGLAEYAVHLGYIKNVANDFNCYRNCNYTYNVTVAGLNEIRVEAYNEGERNAAEGIVTDVDNPTIMLDSHYACFNIMLTKEELTGNAGKAFGYLLTTYEGNNAYTYYDSYIDPLTGNEVTGNDEKALSKHIDWIEIMPTTDLLSLAEYCPSQGELPTGKSETDRALNIKEFAEKVRNGDYANESDPTGKEYYFTVFVNEYTYEPRYGETNYGNETIETRWPDYVNHNPRRFYLRVTKRVSEDGKSIYVRSKYSAQQRSIQTYYSTTNLAEGVENPNTAVGVERENETEGLNMRDTYGGGSDPDNGRWNVAQYLSGQARTAETLNINSNNVNSRPNWSAFVGNRLMTRGAVTGERAQNGPDLPARGESNPIPIPALNLITSDVNPIFTDPQNINEAIEAINACTSRNRDNNGNGKIDPEELRWYVPAVGKYLRLILGRNSLGETPLMNYKSIKDEQLPLLNNATNDWGSEKFDDGYCSRYFFAASNYFKDYEGSAHVQVLWAIQGMSTSAWGEYSKNPWQVRCLRNLGTNLNSVSKGHKVSMAYQRRPGTNIVEMTYYDPASVRIEKLEGNGNDEGQMPIHVSTNNQYNMAYKAFEFKTDKDLQISADSLTLELIPEYIITKNPCTINLGEGWRVPNQFELAVMRNLGIFNTESNAYKLWVSCTALYFNMSDGQGSSNYTSTNQELFVVTKDKGTRLSDNNINYMITQGNAGIWIRCVKDAD